MGRGKCADGRIVVQNTRMLFRKTNRAVDENKGLPPCKRRKFCELRKIADDQPIADIEHLALRKRLRVGAVVEHVDAPADLPGVFKNAAKLVLVRPAQHRHRRADRLGSAHYRTFQLFGFT